MSHRNPAAADTDTAQAPLRLPHPGSEVLVVQKAHPPDVQQPLLPHAQLQLWTPVLPHLLPKWEQLLPQLDPAPDGL